jgi:hypothetical protein
LLKKEKSKKYKYTKLIRGKYQNEGNFKKIVYFARLSANKF